MLSANWQRRCSKRLSGVNLHNGERLQAEEVNASRKRSPVSIRKQEGHTARACLPPITMGRRSRLEAWLGPLQKSRRHVHVFSIFVSERFCLSGPFPYRTLQYSGYTREGRRHGQ